MPTTVKILPTATLARLLMPDDWTHLEKDCGQLLAITSPKSLTEKKQKKSAEIPSILMDSGAK
ncbi:MAG: hypothetical protein FJ190_08235 [Gammaproteobacteria bacterium]|nr:hypothetical protein [Gammaproteobacteria bacterium]